MLNVCCVEHGNYSGRGADYVNNLFAAIERNIGDVPWRPVCFRNSLAGLREGIDVRSLPAGLWGWWTKLYLFSAEAFAKGERVLYFDLDTVICGPIATLAECKSDFASLRDFGRPRGIGSGVMAWEAGAVDIWEQWNGEERPHLSGGDQAYIEVAAHRRWGHHIQPHRVLQVLYPEMFRSFKWECQDGPGRAAVICFHGQPKPHNCGEDWIARHWQRERTLAPQEA